MYCWISITRISRGIKVNFIYVFFEYYISNITYIVVNTSKDNKKKSELSRFSSYRNLIEYNVVYIHTHDIYIWSLYYVYLFGSREDIHSETFCEEGKYVVKFKLSIYIPTYYCRHSSIMIFLFSFSMFI